MDTVSKKQNGLSSNDRLLIFFSFLMAIVAPFSSDSYTPSLPMMAHALGASADRMQLTMTSYLLGVSTSQLVYGPLSDRFGRRPVILIGLSIVVLGSILCALSFSAYFVIFARLIQGIGAGVCNALFRAVVRDKFSGHKMSEISSYIGMSYTLAFAAAPVLGGYIQTYFDWRANFVFIAIMTFTIVGLLWYSLPETHSKPDATATKLKNVFRNYYFLLTFPDFSGYTILSGLAFSGFVAYYTSAPFLLEDIVGLSPTHFGWLSMGIALGLLAGMFINARLVATLGIATLLLVGLIIMLVSSVIMLAIALMGIINTYVIVIPLVMFACAASFVFANAMTHAFHEVGHIAGSAGGMYGFLQVLSGSITSIFVAKLHEPTQVPLASVLTALSLIAIILYWLLARRKPQS